MNDSLGKIIGIEGNIVTVKIDYSNGNNELIEK